MQEGRDPRVETLRIEPASYLFDDVPCHRSVGDPPAAHCPVVDVARDETFRPAQFCEPNRVGVDGVKRRHQSDQHLAQLRWRTWRSAEFTQVGTADHDTITIFDKLKLRADDGCVLAEMNCTW